MKLLSTIVLTVLCFVLQLNVSNAQKMKKHKQWDFYFETPALSSPFVQVGYDGLNKKRKYYFKQIDKKDSTFVLNIYDKIDGILISSFKGKYLYLKGDSKPWSTILCDSIWGYTDYGSKFCGRSICYGPIRQFSNSNNPFTNQLRNKLYGNYLIFDGDYIETCPEGYKTIYRYKNGGKQGPFYTRTGLNDFMVGQYLNDSMDSTWTTYHINEYYDTIPIEKYQYKNNQRDGIYQKFWENGALSESGFYWKGSKTRMVTSYDKNGKKIKESEAPLEVENEIYDAWEVDRPIEGSRCRSFSLSGIEKIKLARRATFEASFVFYFDEHSNGKLIYETYGVHKHISKKQIETIKSAVILNAKSDWQKVEIGELRETIWVLKVSYK